MTSKHHLPENGSAPTGMVWYSDTRHAWIREGQLLTGRHRRPDVGAVPPTGMVWYSDTRHAWIREGQLLTGRHRA